MLTPILVDQKRDRCRNNLHDCSLWTAQGATGMHANWCLI